MAASIVRLANTRDLRVEAPCGVEHVLRDPLMNFGIGITEVAFRSMSQRSRGSLAP